MKSSIARFVAIIFIGTLALAACSKKYNDLHSYPSDYRILGFNLTTQYYYMSPTFVDVPVTPVYTENYKFEYDNLNRVAKTYYTTNDPAKINVVSYFTYSNDSIYKTTKTLNEVVVRIDTFINDQNNNITYTMIGGAVTNYLYFGNLLTRWDTVSRDGHYYAPQTNYTYSSFNGDLAHQVYSFDTMHDQKYIYYTEFPNRPGDYLQLNSFATYGYNFYQNKHMIQSITYTDPVIKFPATTTLEYQMDAYNKVIKTVATSGYDTGGHTTSIATYDIQYEKYK